jgi:hypothetical protein
MLFFMICSLRVGDVECDALRRVPLLSYGESLPMPSLGSGAIFERRQTESISTSPYAASAASHTCRIMAPGPVISDVRETSVKNAKKARSISPPSGAPRRIGAVADEERSRPQFE